MVSTFGITDIGVERERKCWCGNDDTIRTSRFEVLVENLACREQRRPLYLVQAARQNFVNLKHRVVPNLLNLRAMVNELLTIERRALRKYYACGVN